MEWLYGGPAAAVNREEYLLGKKIDRMIDPTLQEAEREKEVRLLTRRESWRRLDSP